MASTKSLTHQANQTFTNDIRIEIHKKLSKDLVKMNRKLNSPATKSRMSVRTYNFISHQHRIRFERKSFNRQKAFDKKNERFESYQKLIPQSEEFLSQIHSILNSMGSEQNFEMIERLLSAFVIGYSAINEGNNLLIFPFIRQCMDAFECGSITNCILFQSYSLYEYVMSNCETNTLLPQDDCDIPQEDWFDKIAKVLSLTDSHRYEVVRNFITVCSCVVITCISHKIFGREVLNNIFLASFLPSFKDMREISLKSGLIALVEIINKVKKYFTQGTSIFNDSTVFNKWFLNVTLWTKDIDIMMWHKQYDCVYLDQVKINDLVSRYESLKKEGEKIINVLRKVDTSLCQSITHRFTQMTLLFNNFDMKCNQSTTRVPPFSLFFYGESGMGKSTLNYRIHQILGNILGYKATDLNMYVKAFTDKFWSGLTNGVQTVILDDVAALKPKSSEVDPSIEDIHKLCNGMSFNPPMSESKEKGNIALKPMVVIASSNVQDANASAYFTNAYSVHRRFIIHITMKVKPEFSNDSGGLDRTKVFSHKDYDEEDPFGDYWIFTINKPVAVKTQGTDVTTSTFQKVVEFEHVKDFLNYICERADIYVKGEAEVLKKNSIVTYYCRECKSVQYKCEHKINDINLQVDEIKDVSSTRNIFVGVLVSMYCFVWFINWKWGIKSVFTYLSIFIKCFWHVIRCIRFLYRVNRVSNKFKKYIECNSSMLQYLAFGILCVVSGIVLTKAIRPVKQERHLPQDDDDEEEYCFIRPPSSEFVVKEKSSFSTDVPRLSSVSIPNQIHVVESHQREVKTTPQQSSASRFSLNEFANLIKSNMYRITICRIDNVTSSANAFCLGGQYFTINRHVLKPHICDLNTKIILAKPSKNGNIKNSQMFDYHPKIVKYISQDLVVIKLNVVPHKDLRKYISPLPFEGVSGLVCIVNKDLSVRTAFSKNITKQQTQCDIVNDGKPLMVYGGYGADTIDGDCGAPLIVKTPNSVHICGFHVGSNEGGVRMVYTHPYELPEEIMNANWVLANKIKDTTISDVDSLGPIPENHKLSDISGRGDFIGYIPNCGVHAKATGEKTKISDFVAHEFSEYEFLPPKLNKSSAMIKNLLPMLDTCEGFNESLIKHCSKRYLSDCISILNEKEYSEIFALKPLTDFEALNGIDGDMFVNKLNRQTSIGWPRTGSKSKYMIYHDDKVLWNEELKNEYKEMERNLKHGLMGNIIFKGTMKDEVLPAEKVLNGKARMFTACNGVSSTLIRKYFLPVAAFMQRYSFVFENAIGVNVYCSVWDTLRKYMTFFGENNMVAGDFAKYDKRMHRCIITQALRVLYRIAKISKNYTLEDLMCIKTLSADIANPLVITDGVLIRYFGSNSSGHPLTVVVNSIANSIMMRYVYCILNPEHDIETFRDNVRLLTYGDDNLLNIRDCITNWFNHTMIQQCFSDIGIEYTMAEKDAESKPLISMDECSFLKRTWVYNVDLKCYTSRLSWSSICKNIMWKIPSKNLSCEEHEVTKMINVMRELSYYNEIFYNKYRVLFTKVICNLEWQAWLPQGFPSYEEAIKTAKESLNP